MYFSLNNLLRFSKYSLRKMGDMKNISDIVSLYKDLALVSSPTSALLQCKKGNLINVYSTWSIPDVIRAETTAFSREFLLDCEKKKFTVLSSGLPSDISSVSQYAFAKSGNRCAVLRKTKKTEESLFLEIWNSSKKECTFDMSDVKEHGTVQDSGIFSSFEWSSDEKYLLYIANEKQKKSESFFKYLFRQKTDSKSSEDVVQGEEFIYRASWGERHASTHHTVLCIFEISSGKVETLSLDDKYQNMSIAEATWGPNDEYIVFVGFEENPSPLGVVFCSNRRSAIFSYNVKSKDVEHLVTGENISVRSPVFSPNYENFVFLQNKAGGPHASTKKLMKYDWRKKELSIVIDIVENAHGNTFAGVYTDKLSPRWWSSNNRLFFFHTIRSCFVEIYCVDVFTSKLQRIEYGKDQYSSFILDVKDPYIVASMSSMNKSPSLMIGYIDNANDEIQVSWSVVENSALELQDLHWKVDILTPPLQNERYPNLDYNIITMWSKEKKNGSLIIFPHGGPHSAFTVNYLVHAAAFAKLGFIVCQVNYRGSLGLGENNVMSLPGNVGSQDVADVVNAIEFLKKDLSLGIHTVLGFGGSHGGFLVAHLLGQYPTLLKAAVVRNPVIDLTTMIGATDIPDWCWIESGTCEIYDAMKPVDFSVLEKLWEKSPIKYMKDIISPTLLQLGKVDLRVPSSQGLQFYRHLKAQNVATKVLYYDDNHSLLKVGVASDAFVHVVSWFLEHSTL